MERENGGQPFVVQWNNSEGGITEGPLSLLWSLIESYKVDIFEVSLSRITEDFLNFIKFSESIHIDVGAEYALMAANLVYLKSKALLPDPGFEEEDYDPPLPPELVEKLLEHKKYQLSAQRLSEIDKLQGGIFHRETNQVIDEADSWLDLSLLDLISAFNEILEKREDETEIPALLTTPHRYSVEEKMGSISELLAERSDISFEELFSEVNPEKAEIVAVFLAMLELCKQRIVSIRQHKIFGEIRIFLVGEPWNATKPA
ncbi:segregation and condensation protein A [Leptospira wolffii]|uniref:Segregation and condensation protein A n=1 Tax=Leptospira wolffii TaxID=409998 RepID=A0A2M9Z8A2_9LEPT|nr:segregation/condensation protein A [Leptospira wolffii]EPG67982.1 ScpA/B protein [Leptospira wolffii serovar Khorat str. Khorat-H2]PJZ64587.1 ribulose phosphate epimerase [Leptospira wolffii]TGK55167.1 ribulose phosphate epimerase [Leptospira wolffii]TGK70532.1 ribulose phosphate epimerase [Leptospira wolffii]TGK77620.1 ribulose phosphate epimerase [Leptospira wolffii]